jgi:hypothetical protein
MKKVWQGIPLARRRMPPAPATALSRCACVFMLAATMSADAEPLHDHDNGPLTGFFGIPDSTEGSLLVPAGANRWDLLLQSSSHSIFEVEENEIVLFDGETTRLELNYRRGVGEHWEIGIELPYVWHESGGLDQVVSSWHDWTGLPGAFRETRPKDQLEFIYQDPTGTVVDFGTNANGIGDVRLIAGYRPFPGNHPGFAIRFGLKLPTGDSENLMGSGGTDVSLGIAGDTADFLGVTGLSAFYRLSAVLVGEPDALGSRYREVMGHTSFGLGYALGSSVDLRLQGALRTAAYDSDVEVLGDLSGTVNFGAIFRLSDRTRLAVGVGEDVLVRSAPDVTFQVSLRYHSR